MASGLQRNSNGLPTFSKTKQLEWKRKMLVFSFFLVVAMIFWLLNALNKNYTTEIKYPITYSKFPENKLLVNDVPRYLKLEVNAHGYPLLSYKLTKRPVPINFPVSSFNMNRLVGDTSTSYLLTRYVSEQVVNQLPDELELISISPDTLFFQFAAEQSKKLPVRARINYTTTRDFTVVGGIKIIPDSIQLSGPDIFLDTLTAVYTEKLDLGELTKSYSGTLEIDSYHGIRYEQKELSCTIELEKLTEVQLEVPVQITNLPDSLRMQTFPQKIKVRGRVGLSNYERIVPEAFWAEVDYMDIQENKTRLQVNLRTSPAYLQGVNFYPQTVEYLLSVK